MWVFVPQCDMCPLKPCYLFGVLYQSDESLQEFKVAGVGVQGRHVITGIFSLHSSPFCLGMVPVFKMAGIPLLGQCDSSTQTQCGLGRLVSRAYFSRDIYGVD